LSPEKGQRKQVEKPAAIKKEKKQTSSKNIPLYMKKLATQMKP